MNQPPDLIQFWQQTEDPDFHAVENAIHPAPVHTPTPKPLSALVTHVSSDPSRLLGNRYLCRGGGMLMVGPTGIGKSSAVMQAVIQWSIGQPFMGIQPNGRLRSIIVQAENDDGDMAEMRDGIFKGLNLSESQRASAGQSIKILMEDTRSGMEFFQMLDSLLESNPTDLLVIDPALAYLGGETSSQRDVGAFLRNGLNPVIHKHLCAGIVVHHTNKPPSGQEKSDWKAGDFAYLGSGSAEWANWARAVLGIRSKGKHDQFELVAGKRGGRIGWKDENNNPIYARPIAHHKEPGVICWVEGSSSTSEHDHTSSTPTLDEFITIFPVSINDKAPESAVLTAEQIKSIFARNGWNKNTYKALRDEAEAKGLLVTISGKHNRKYCGKPELARAFYQRVHSKELF